MGEGLQKGLQKGDYKWKGEIKRNYKRGVYKWKVKGMSLQFLIKKIRASYIIIKQKLKIKECCFCNNLEKF